MEKELFDSDGWDINDTMVFTFYDVTLKVQLGKYSPGSKFADACIDYGEGVLTLFEGEEIAAKFKLSFGTITELPL